MKRIEDQSLYEILDVRDDATADEIGAACARALVLYGPGSLATYTLMSPEEAALLVRRIEEARTTLLDAGARARYDDSLRRAAEVRAATAVAVGAPAPVLAARPSEPALPVEDELPLLARLPPPDDDEAGEDEGTEAELRPPAQARREDAPRAAEPAAPAAPQPRPAPRPPIRLEREIRPPAPPASPEPAAPATTPLPLVPAAAASAVLPEGGSWSGDVLRRLREARGISLQQIADRTKVTRHHIENIEAERFEQLPAPVYLRGILLALARELRLDGQKVARSYLERIAKAR